MNKSLQNKNAKKTCNKHTFDEITKIEKMEKAIFK